MKMWTVEISAKVPDNLIRNEAEVEFRNNDLMRILPQVNGVTQAISSWAHANPAKVALKFDTTAPDIREAIQRGINIFGETLYRSSFGTEFEIFGIEVIELGEQ